MNIFDYALLFTLKHEGGYVNDPKDPGGETNHGISDRRDGLTDGKADINGDRVPDVAIRDLTKAQAAAIYRRDYWDACCCDELPAAVAVAVFDAAVNLGCKRAAVMLQRAIGAKEDGAIGPVTIRQAKQYSPKLTAELINKYRTEFYRSLPTFSRFGRGWISRVNALAVHVGELDGGA